MTPRDSDKHAKELDELYAKIIQLEAEIEGPGGKKWSDLAVAMKLRCRELEGALLEVLCVTRDASVIEILKKAIRHDKAVEERTCSDPVQVHEPSVQDLRS